MKKVLIIIAVSLVINFVFFRPAKAGLVPVIDASNLTANTTTAVASTAQKIQTFIIDFVIKPMIRKVANSLESKLVNKVNGQIANITGGAPSFITNWRNYLLDSQARGNDVFRSVLADTNLCDYFGEGMKTAFGADKFAGVINSARITNGSGGVVYENKTTVPGTPSFQYSASCTLPAGFDVDAYIKDFKNGGWDAWNKLIEPQNNPLGVYALAINEQSKQIAIEQQSTMDSAVAGNGFLAQKLGAGTSGIGPTGCVSTFGTLSGGASGPTKTTRCTFMGKDVTPSKILSDSAANALDTKLKRPGAATELTDIVLNLFASILTGVTNRLSNYIGQAAYDSLSGSGSTGFTESQYTEDVTAKIQDGGPQAQSVTNTTDQAGNQIKNEVNSTNPGGGGISNDSACVTICLAGGSDQAACDARCGVAP